MASVADVFDDVINVISPLFRQESDLAALRAKVADLREHLGADIHSLVTEAVDQALANAQ